MCWWWEGASIPIAFPWALLPGLELGSARRRRHLAACVGTLPRQGARDEPIYPLPMPLHAATSPPTRQGPPATASWVGMAAGWRVREWQTAPKIGVPAHRGPIRGGEHRWTGEQAPPEDINESNDSGH